MGGGVSPSPRWLFSLFSSSSGVRVLYQQHCFRWIRFLPIGGGWWTAPHSSFFSVPLFLMALLMGVLFSR